jgi:hypothetical protein
MCPILCLLNSVSCPYEIIQIRFNSSSNACYVLFGSYFRPQMFLVLTHTTSISDCQVTILCLCKFPSTRLELIFSYLLGFWFFLFFKKKKKKIQVLYFTQVTIYKNLAFLFHVQLSPKFRMASFFQL